MSDEFYDESTNGVNNENKGNASERFDPASVEAEVNAHLTRDRALFAATIVTGITAAVIAIYSAGPLLVSTFENQAQDWYNQQMNQQVGQQLWTRP